MIKVWIAGANGQIGTALNEVADPLKFEIMDTDIEEVNVADMDEVLRYAQMARPDIIINCAAMTDVKECKENPKDAYLVNALGARNLAIVARKFESILVQISTDDVFDGNTSEPYREFDQTNPVTVYGKSKLSGENYAKEFTQKHFIIRSNWVFGKGKNFVKNILERTDSEDSIAVATDQYGSPTSAKDLARFIWAIVETNRYGTYHATSRGVCSRYEFAEEILKLAGKDNKLEKITTEESEFSHARPPYAVLDNFILSCEKTYDFQQWKDALAEYIKEAK